MLAPERKREARTSGLNSMVSLSREQVHGRRGRSLVSIYRINAHSGTKTTAQLSTDSAQRRAPR
jgi:hypothetical protein